MAYSLMLNDDWDLEIDKAGKIKTVSDEYAIAQNVANAVRLFKGEAFYEPDRGIPHFETTFGRKVSMSVILSRLNTAAKSVDEVVDAETTLESEGGRIVGGDIEIMTSEGVTVDVAL